MIHQYRFAIVLFLVAFALFIYGCTQQGAYSPAGTSTVRALLGGTPGGNGGNGGGPQPSPTPGNLGYVYANSSEFGCDVSFQLCTNLSGNNMYAMCPSCTGVNWSGPDCVIMLCNSQVALYKGPPKQGQNCNKSLAVGDNAGNVNGVPQTIGDINTIAAFTGFKVLSNGQLQVGVKDVGWVYKDTGGHYWVQNNGETQWTWNASVSAFFASFGISAPTDTSIHPAGTNAPKSKTGQAFQPCFSQGMDLSTPVIG